MLKRSKNLFYGLEPLEERLLIAFANSNIRIDDLMPFDFGNTLDVEYITEKKRVRKDESMWRVRAAG